MDFKKLIPVIFVICFSAQFAHSQYFSKRYADGELLVKFKNGTTSGRAAEANNRLGSIVLEQFPELKWQRVKIPAGLTVAQAVSHYKNMAEVEAVQPNYYYHLLSTPNDTRFSELYGLAKISAPAAWNLTTGSAETVVAVIDTGVKYDHEDLAANIWTNPGEIPGNGIDDDGNGFVDDYYGYDFFFNDSDPLDENGHGTHVSGTIGAVGNNGIGVVGVNWSVKLMTVKIYNSTGFGTTSAMLINAYNYVRMMKNRGVNIRAANHSYSGCDEACGYDQATKDALDAMGDAGILNVIAAGNGSRNIDTGEPAFPASYTSPSVLSVAASNANDEKAGFSNFGATSVDLATPGVGILSTISTASKYTSFSGTSMAAPHAAGAAALLSSYNPSLSPESLKATLMNTVDPLANWNGIVKTGGRLNIDRALRNQTVCSFSLSQDYIFVPEFTGGNFSVNVFASPNCDYRAVSNVDWINVTNGNPGSGNGTISFSVAANSGLSRTGSMTIAGLTFSIVQHGGDPAPFNPYLLDFDGDWKTDYSAIQNVNGGMVWHNNLSQDGYRPVSFGSFDDIAVPADYDGDGKTDIAVWRASTGAFYGLRSGDNTFQAAGFGASGDDPRITQDFDGDGKADFSVTRKADGNLYWYILGSTGGFFGVQFGFETDIPVRGDFDGDGKADVAVFRPSNGTWYLLKSREGFAAIPFGLNTDKIVPADYDGDGKTDLAVFRPSNGTWYLLQSRDGFAGFVFGQEGDLPTPGDYDGDGKTDISVWRPNQNPNDAGVFHTYSQRNGYTGFGWGNSTMKIPANTIQDH